MQTGQTIDEVTQRNVEAIAKMEKTSVSQRTFGDRVADGVAATVGSWWFIIIQTIVLLLWMAANLVGWFYQWDPYPFILLNLALSFQAAFASPIIMMSQNRQAKLFERRNQLDLQINLLAEQENTEQLKLLRLLCEKAGIRIERKAPTKALEQATQLEELVRQIEGAEEPKTNGITPA
ncbi:MAG: DUF1003 domain-containing protein [Gemmataceae bacterium]